MSYGGDLITSIMEHDPAARSRLEVRLLYAGYKAVMSHRRANWFYRHGMKFIARAVSERCKMRTGIEIHPAAKIGRGVLIDHGVGVVIGETAEVGDGCVIYQGVTLGGTGKDKGKRHPTLGKNVLVGAGAKILGPFNVGDNARIAAGAVVLSEVPAGATAVGVPARISRIDGAKTGDLDQIHYLDLTSQDLCHLTAELERLKKQVGRMTDDSIDYYL